MWELCISKCLTFLKEEKWNLTFNCLLHDMDSIKCPPLATEPGISLITLPLIRILQRNLKQTTGTFLIISHTTNVLLIKFCCNIFIGVRIIKEMPDLVASGTHCVIRWRVGGPPPGNGVAKDIQEFNSIKLRITSVTQSVPRSKTSHLMLYIEIIPVCYEIHTKHINTLCGQNMELLNVELVVYIVTTGL